MIGKKDISKSLTFTTHQRRVRDTTRHFPLIKPTQRPNNSKTLITEGIYIAQDFEN